MSRHHYTRRELAFIAEAFVGAGDEEALDAAAHAALEAML